MIFKHQYIFAFLIFLSFLSFCSGADKLPTAEDINSVIEEAGEIINGFWQESFDLRMRCEFAGKFLTEGDRLKLLELSKNAAQNLHEIIQKQQKFIDLVENYEGDDWEQRYGQNGLWRKLRYGYDSSRCGQCLLDSYRALTSAPQKRNEIIRQTVSQIEELNQDHRPDIAKARALVLIARLEPGYKDAALKELDRFNLFSDVYRPTAAEIEKMKLLNEAEPKNIQLLIERIEQNSPDSYKEFLTQLIILQRKYDFDSYIKTIDRHPEIKAFFCQLISHSILNCPDFVIGAFETQMAANYALQNGPDKHKELLIKLEQNNDSNSPLIDYAAAMLLLDTDKRKAAKLLVKASQSHNKNPHPHLKIDAAEIAKFAAIKGYELYLKDPNYAETAAWTFYNYREIGGEKIDEDIQWLFAHMHIDNFDAVTGYDILGGIQKRGGKYSKKASLYLASQQISSEAYKDSKQRLILLQQFADLLSDHNDCCFYNEASGLVNNTLLQIENFNKDPNTIKNCLTIAEFLNQCDNQPLTKLLLAEAILLCPENKQIEQVKNLVSQAKQGYNTDNLQLIRCQARLNQETGRFSEAALLWGKIAASLDKAKENETINWCWWRAKYYQLYCAYEAGENPEDVSHVIDVLRADRAEISAPWEEKLAQLQQNLTLE
ncbi:MAG: hypothetical protein JW804_00705 [Sedimentisphaerales bacterium]|nr:hypothetical protein [Sedimentisphaerales bacterium]